MIVVLGSRHDAVAAALVGAWPGAALCSAQDLTQPGWHWRRGEAGTARWVVDGQVVSDREVSGVFVRRSTVYPQELSSTHADDRAYLAAEAQAFLVHVLASTAARVANPVAHGALGDEVLRPERWLAAAAGCGLRVAPLRLASGRALSRGWRPVLVDAVGEQVFGEVPARTRAGVSQLMRQLGLWWACFVFDRRGQLRSITSARAPGNAASAALGRLLSGAPA